MTQTPILSCGKVTRPGYGHCHPACCLGPKRGSHSSDINHVQIWIGKPGSGPDVCFGYQTSDRWLHMSPLWQKSNNYCNTSPILFQMSCQILFHLWGTYSLPLISPWLFTTESTYISDESRKARQTQETCGSSVTKRVHSRFYHRHDYLNRLFHLRRTHSCHRLFHLRKTYSLEDEFSSSALLLEACCSINKQRQ